MLLAVFLTVPGIANVLGHTVPPALGWSLGLLVVPAVLLVDAATKRLSARGAGGAQVGRPGPKTTEDPAPTASADRC